MASLTTPRELPPGSGITARLAPAVRPWADLSPDLLLDISNRLHDAGDFTRFHAVCTPWRDVLSLATIPPTFPPWFFSLCDGQIMHSTVDIRCISSSEKASNGYSHGDVVLAEPLGAGSTGGDRNWVVSADGTASWLFVVSPEPRLVHLLTGAVTLLPQFPDDDEIRVPMENAHGIVYGDRTVFLFRFSYKNSESKFIAAILRPDHTVWTVLKRNLEVLPGPHSYPGAAYQDGKVLVCVGDFWSLLTPGDIGGDGFAGLQSRWNASPSTRYYREGNYVLESQGELLWASIRLKQRRRIGLRSTPSVTVHALEEGAAGGVMRWAVRDGWSLADRILFLGSPTSFAVDAHRLGMGGGCAYFVLGGSVFRYNLVSAKKKLIKKLPRGCATGGMARVWIWRQPTIAPIQEIQESLRLYSNKKQKICN